MNKKDLKKYRQLARENIAKQDWNVEQLKEKLALSRAELYEWKMHYQESNEPTWDAYHSLMDINDNLAKMLRKAGFKISRYEVTYIEEYCHNYGECDEITPCMECDLLISKKIVKTLKFYDYEIDDMELEAIDSHFGTFRKDIIKLVNLDSGRIIVDTTLEAR